MEHQLIYNKSQFTELCMWLQFPVLDVHPSLVHFQLCCHSSKTITATLLKVYQKAIIKLFSSVHSVVGVEERLCVCVCLCVTVGVITLFLSVSILLWPSMCLTCLLWRYLDCSGKGLICWISTAGKVGNYFPWLPSFYSNPSLSGALWLYRAQWWWQALLTG